MPGANISTELWHMRNQARLIEPTAKNLESMGQYLHDFVHENPLHLGDEFQAEQAEITEALRSLADSFSACGTYTLENIAAPILEAATEYETNDVSWSWKKLAREWVLSS